MELVGRDLDPFLDSTKSDPQNVIPIEWQDYEHELARLLSLSSAITEIKEKKQVLQLKLDSLMQVRAESLSRSNELEEMHQKLEAKRIMMGTMSMNCRIAKDNAKRKEENLSKEVRSLLVSGTALSVARKQLLESDAALAGEKCYARLKNVQKRLRQRQQYMISQISMLYPVKILVGPAEEQELDSFPDSRRSGNATGSRFVNQGSLTILGFHLSMLPFTKMSFFTNKKEAKRSATALGYVAQVVSLVASYLRVPLRYPLRLGGSCSFICDCTVCTPSVEPTSAWSSNYILSGDVKPVEFSLFLDGQDTTRAAYAVFLLNKDLEQLLNFIGVESLGPRHVLGNLKELIRTIQSVDYLDS